MLLKQAKKKRERIRRNIVFATHTPGLFFIALSLHIYNISAVFGGRYITRSIFITASTNMYLFTGDAELLGRLISLQSTGKIRDNVHTQDSQGIVNHSGFSCVCLIDMTHAKHCNRFVLILTCCIHFLSWPISHRTSTWDGNCLNNLRTHLKLA